MQKVQADEEQYAKLLQQVVAQMDQFGSCMAALSAGLSALDGRAVERAPLPDARPILAELERVQPPPTFATQHSGALLFLRAARDLRSVKGDVADAVRTIKHATWLMEHCNEVLQQILAAMAREGGA